MISLQSVLDGDVDFRAVKGTVPGLDLPRVPEAVQTVRQLLLRLVPHGHLSQEFLRPSRQPELEGEAENAVNALEEVQSAHHLALNLFDCAENVGVVLLEPSHSREPRQGPGKLVPVEDTEIGQPQRKLPPRSDSVVEDQTETKRTAINSQISPSVP